MREQINNSRYVLKHSRSMFVLPFAHTIIVNMRSFILSNSSAIPTCRFVSSENLLSEKNIADLDSVLS